MSNGYTCPIQACKLLTLKIFIEVIHGVTKVPYVADFIAGAQGQTRIVHKSCAGNLLLWSHLTLDPPSRSNEDSQT